MPTKAPFQRPSDDHFLSTTTSPASYQPASGELWKVTLITINTANSITIQLSDGSTHRNIAVTPAAADDLYMTELLIDNAIFFRATFSAGRLFATFERLK